MSGERTPTAPLPPDVDPETVDSSEAFGAEDVAKIFNNGIDEPVVENAVNNPELIDTEQEAYDKQVGRANLRADRQLRFTTHAIVDKTISFGEKSDTKVGDAKHQVKEWYTQKRIDSIAQRKDRYDRRAETALFGFRRRKFAAKSRSMEARLSVASSFKVAERNRYDKAISHDEVIRKPVTEIYKNKTYIKNEAGEFELLSDAQRKEESIGGDTYKKKLHGDYYKNEAGEIVSIYDEKGSIIEEIVEIKHIAGSREKRETRRDESVRAKLDKVISEELKLKMHGKTMRKQFFEQKMAAMRDQLLEEGVNFATEHLEQVRREVRDKISSNPKYIKVAKKILANEFVKDPAISAAEKMIRKLRETSEAA
jgi:hypothetical protein